MATIDSYSETNQSTNANLYVGATIRIGQSFTCSSSSVLQSCKFYLRRYGTSTGNVTTKIYAHSGTYGTSSVPTGAALATSDNVDITTIATGSYNLVTFTFSGANQISLTASTYYCVEILYNDASSDGANLLGVAFDASSPTHSGNYFIYTSSYASNNSNDTCFYVTGGDILTFTVSDTVALTESTIISTIKMFVVSSSLALSEVITTLKIKVFNVSDNLTLTEIITNTIVRLFSNLTRHLATLANLSKTSESSKTNATKNSASWINQDKS